MYRGELVWFDCYICCVLCIILWYLLMLMFTFVLSASGMKVKLQVRIVVQVWKLSRIVHCGVCSVQNCHSSVTIGYKGNITWYYNITLKREYRCRLYGSCVVFVWISLLKTKICVGSNNMVHKRTVTLMNTPSMVVT